MLQIAFTLNWSKLLWLVISFSWKQQSESSNQNRELFCGFIWISKISSVKCLCSGFRKKSMYLINLWYSLYKAAWQIPKFMIITWKNVCWCKLILLQSFYYLEWGMLLTGGVYLTIDTCNHFIISMHEWNY